MTAIKYLIAVCVLALVSVSGPAGAVTVQFEYSGYVTSTDYSGGDPFSGQVQVGTRFNGFYEFEFSPTRPTGGACDINSQCRWEFLVPPNSFSASLGAVNLNAPNRIVIVQTNGITNSIDDYSVSTGHDNMFDGFAGESLAMQLGVRDTNGLAITDAGAMLVDSFDLNDFQLAYFNILGIVNGRSSKLVGGQLETLARVNPVPLPAAFPLFLTALAGLLALGYRRAGS